ncbi:endonuclease/exonuclease/phosphatase family protein, partial [bacterium]|nr:endonuclease/exonuclease/phosphatase family protein [bacterium]
MKSLWIVVFQGLTLLIILAGVLDLPETLPFFLELITHFRTQYALFSLLLILFFLLQGNRLFLILAIGAFLLHFTGLLQWSIPGTSRKTTGEELRVLVFNVQYSNRQHSSVIEEVQAANAHVVGILELSHTWKQALSPLEEIYPYRHHLPRDDGFGLGIYSKEPLEKTNVLHLGKVPVPTLVADLRLRTGPVHLVLTHALPPVSPEYFHLRNIHLSELAAHMKESRTPQMIMGDLNVTMF